MKPRMEKTTKPAKKLVPLLMRARMKASLQERTGEDIRGKERTGEDRRGHQRTSEVRRGQERTSEDRRGHQRTGEDIRR